MEKNMTSKQRAYLKGLAMTMEPIFQLGKASLTPEFTKSVDEALTARELIKITVLKNCFDDPKVVAQALAERTRSQVVQVIGRKIVLYRHAKDGKIVLPE
jgi:RNA-binding protein